MLYVKYLKPLNGGDMKMTIRRMRFVRRQKYKIYIFVDNWLTRKVKETEGRELTFLETCGLIVGYITSKLTDPYN